MRYAYCDMTKSYCEVIEIISDIESEEMSNKCYKFVKFNLGYGVKSQIGTTVEDINEADMVEIYVLKDGVSIENYSNDNVLETVTIEITNN